MGREWETYKLSTIIDLIGGGTPKRSNPDYWNGDIPWLSVKDFNNSYRHVSNAEKSITKGGLDNSSTKLLEPGQIIISARGTVGALAQLSKPMAFNQSCYGITGKPGYAINDFVYYLLRYAVSNLKRMTHGAVFDTITRETFDYLAVSIPSIPEQRKIAHILGTLDDKIELNRRMNATLEEMAQALFKSWFVDFDPVVDNALRAGNHIPDELADRAATRKEMLDSGKASHNPEIHPLFPDGFQDSELGPIPVGWRKATVKEEFDVTAGQSPPGSTYNEEKVGIPFFQGRRDFGFRYPKNRVYCTQPKRLANAGDTLMSVRAPVGDLNMAYEQCCIGRGVAAIRHKSGSGSYTYYSLLALSRRISSYDGDGTVFGSISKKQLYGLPAITPSRDLISIFEEITGKKDEKILVNTNEISLLSAR